MSRRLTPLLPECAYSLLGAHEICPHPGFRLFRSRLSFAFFSAVTVEDEIKVCTELIAQFVQAVRYHDDADQQLNFYVECRGAFIKLDAVLVVLVQVSILFKNQDPFKPLYTRNAILSLWMPSLKFEPAQLFINRDLCFRLYIITEMMMIITP